MNVFQSNTENYDESSDSIWKLFAVYPSDNNQCGRIQIQLVTGCNPNNLDIWTDWCRLGLQFVVYESAEQEWSFINEYLLHLNGLQMFNICMWRHIPYIET